jgi:hypothetical protein
MGLGKYRDVLLGMLVAVVIVTVGGEVLIRVFGHDLVYEQDDLLGWKPKAYFAAHYQKRDQAGTKYGVDFVTLQGGFRAFGQTSGPRKRVLFVGDSYTADPNTSNADAYFGIVGQRLPVEVFAIGAGGYGTLQELLLIRPWLDRIKPDILVLQYCTNDLSDNSFELESRTSHVRNQMNLRPYQVNQSVIHRLPRYHPYVLMYKLSRLFRKIDIEIMMLQYKFDDPTKRSDSPAEAQARAAEKAAAVTLTTQLMAQLAASVPEGTRKLSISCDTADAGESATWQSMARSAGLDPLPSVSGLVEKAGWRGEAVRTDDLAHWNRLGNRIAGEELARLLAERYLDPAEARP